LPKTQKASLISILPRLGSWFHFRFRARFLENEEWDLESHQSNGLSTKFYGLRRLSAVMLSHDDEDDMTFEELTVRLDDGEMKPVSFAVLDGEVQKQRMYLLLLDKPILCRGFAIKLPEGARFGRRNLITRVSDVEYPDRITLAEGQRLRSTAEHRQAEPLFVEYAKMCPEDPRGFRELASVCHVLGQMDRAVGYARTAWMLDTSDTHYRLYQFLRDEQRATDSEEIASLITKLEKWVLPMSEGVVIVDRRARHLFGERNELVTMVREIYQIRRYAAARLLKSLSFPIQSHRQALLYTGCAVFKLGRLHRVDPDDRFHVADDEDRNNFITVQDLKQGCWILPDLEPNDIVVLEYDLVEKVRRDNGRPAIFKLIRPFSGSFPLLRSSVQLEGPRAADIDAVWVNQEQGRGARLAAEHTGKTVTMRLERFTPARYTSLRNEANLLNPLVALGSKGYSWPDIARRCQRSLGSAGLEEDVLPDALRALLDQHETPEQKLATAFYWIRDRLKYASLQTTNANVGNKERARLIVESGTADCKDRAYLMALVCRELGLEWSFVMVNSQDEVVIPEIPADQFDHVIIRVRDGERDRYLDPTSSQSVFGSVPYWQQGSVVLVLSEHPELVTVPEDAPRLNTLEVYESLDSLSDGWLVGGFDCTATGHIARLNDELFKQASLTDSDQVRAAQRLARYVLDSVVLRSFEKVADTGRGDVFRMTGRHQRCRLTSMPGGTDVATLDWNIPFIAVSYLRTLTHAGRFHFAFPSRVRFVTVLGPSVAPRVSELSTLEPLDNPVASISESISRDGDAIKIVREMEIKHKIIAGQDVGYVDPTLARLETALRLVMRLERET
jgi:hypothetical protein